MSETTAYLERAVSRIRLKMCIPGQATMRAFTLSAAANLVLNGRDCPWYRGEDGPARLVADIEAEFPEPTT